MQEVPDFVGRSGEMGNSDALKMQEVPDFVGRSGEI
jgi:hypothetical protein